MRRSILVLSLLVVSMGASTWLLNLIERRTSELTVQLEAPRALAAVRLIATADPVH